MQTYIFLSILTVCFGICAGAFHSQRATIVSEFVPKEQMSSTVGWVILFQGLGNILGPPVAGNKLQQIFKNLFSGLQCIIVNKFVKDLKHLCFRYEQIYVIIVLQALSGIQGKRTVWGITLLEPP